MTTRVTCYWCGDLLTEDQVADPRFSDDEITCDACYQRREQFTCCWCGEYEEQAVQHAYLVVFDAEVVGLRQAGLYAVTHVPYYSSGMIGQAELIRSALTWLGTLPELPADPDGSYPCGHLCAACQATAVAAIATHHARCMMVAAL
jgi:hypothetical protein